MPQKKNSNEHASTESVPIIDLEFGRNVLGNETIAKEILLDMAKDLPQHLALIDNYYQMKSWQKLAQEVHKLHGLLSYCGVPRFKNATAELERNLKSNFDSTRIAVDYEKFQQESAILLKHLSTANL